MLPLIYTNVEKVSPDTDEKYAIRDARAFYVFCPFIQVHQPIENETNTRSDKNIWHNWKTSQITFEC